MNLQFNSGTRLRKTLTTMKTTAGSVTITAGIFYCEISPYVFSFHSNTLVEMT
jgi:hypothetical protein